MQNIDQTPLRKGAQALTAEQATLCTDANTYYKIGGTWTTGENRGFEIDGLGKITYKDGTGISFLFNGASDVSADKNCTITYGLFKNGSLITGAETPHTFDAANKIESISITAFVENLQYDDYFEIYCKSNQVNTTITSKTLSITFLGER
jgi:hypothetical protein